MKQTSQTEVRKFVNPAVEENTTFIRYEWATWGLGIIADRYDDEGYADLSFYYTKDNRIIHRARANLMSTITMNTIGKRLELNIDSLPWTDILTFVTGKTIEIARRGEPLLKVGTKPETMKLEYRLWPILQEGEPATIYCPGGTGKSYLATFIACLVQFDYQGLTDSRQLWTPIQGNVLYLDWEATHSIHLRRTWAVKKGLGIEDERTFLYQAYDKPLVKVVNNIQNLIAPNDIKLLIIDSVMAAQGYGTDPAQIASQFYNTLRSLRCTSLALDHVSKDEMKQSADAESVGPYGSVVKFNRSRQQFELKKHQTKGQNYIELDLIHRKFNEGMLIDDIGIRIDFINDGDGHLNKVTFTSLDIPTHPIFGTMRPLPQRLDDALAEGGLMTPKEIHDQHITDKSEDIIRATLNRYNKKMFVKVGEKWGRVASEV
jgi:hypothetical protein